MTDIFSEADVIYLFVLEEREECGKVLPAST